MIYIYILKRFQAIESIIKIPELKGVPKHRLSDEIEKVVQDHLKYDLQDDLTSNVWELLCSDGKFTTLVGTGSLWQIRISNSFYPNKK